MKNKIIVAVVLSTTSLIYSHPSPFIPPAIYTTLRSDNPITVYASMSVLAYQGVKSFLKQPSKIPLVSQPSNSPKTTVVAFDLHDVMFRPNYFERLTIFLNTPDKLTLRKLMLNPVFLYNLVKISTQQVAAEQVIDELLPRYPELKGLMPAVIESMNAQTPIEGTIKIIEDLKQRGYKIYLLSNIGDRVLQHMIQKFPAIFSYFDEFFYCSPEFNYVRKPNPRYYEAFLEKFNLNPKNVVFVDDLAKNISVANRMGMYGILFYCPQQLQQELASLNILK